MSLLATDPPETVPVHAVRVLIIEDNPGDTILVREMLRDADPAGFELTHSERLSDGIAQLLGGGVQCILLDLSLPDAEGLDALTQVQAVSLDIPVIVFSGRSDERIAVRAVQEGAQDYLIKGQVDGRLLARSINYAIERKRVEVELAHQALHDALTGLPNRGLFLDRLAQALARIGRHSSALAVLFCDLDRFKVVNDSLGHGAGDMLLVDVARRLEDVLRAGDTAARFGGDEFVILCEDITGAHQAIAIAERVSAVLEAPFVLGDDEAFVRTSIGIAMASGQQARPEALLRDADAAMYRAKERGGGVYEVFDDDMRARAVKRLETENALYRALERGEFLLHYQPQVSLATGAVAGLEALVRWQHPERDLVYPGEFIGSAEETGLILEIGAWALREACEQAARWASLRSAESPLRLSVNLSARQCAHPDLVDVVATTLRDTGVDPATICLEITETAVMADMEATVGILDQLRALGVSLAIDDFGTGWSSLRALQRFPVDEVKIDKSFVDGVARDPQEAAIVAAVISLSHALGLRTVAEGLETVSQVDRLRALGCDLAQGFFFWRPAPAADLGPLLSESR
ncbi:MAG: diguanylate cyclase [Solirubrobacteraceae bacterium]|nr:diguanylate cyclase [Solirubrobacteraceae bacterium]